MMKKLIILLVLLLSLTSCKTKQEEVKEPESFEPSTEVQKSTYYLDPIAGDDGSMIIALNTDVCIITTDNLKQEYMRNTFKNLIYEYHKLLDPNNSFEGINNIKTINDNYGKGKVEVDPKLIALLNEAMDLSEMTLGYFNPTIGLASDVWTPLFTYEHVNNDPAKEDVEAAINASIRFDELRDYIIIDETNNTVEFKKYKDHEQVKIDLGAFSKGYVLDKAYEALLKYKCGFLLAAGGSSIYTYKEPSQENLFWTISIKNPNGGNDIFNVKVETIAMSSSGDEQRYFINENGVRRHHILNPFNGYPENNYRGITIIGESGAGALDALTTAMYNVIPSYQEIIISNVEKAYNINIRKAFISEGKDDKLSLSYDEDLAENIVYIEKSLLSDINIIAK